MRVPREIGCGEDTTPGYGLKIGPISIFRKRVGWLGGSGKILRTTEISESLALLPICRANC
jgi:hypothetical protein